MSDTGSNYAVSDIASNKFIREILSNILFDKFGLENASRLIVAYSGGCDSHVLLHSLADLLKLDRHQIIAAHFDHGLQKQSKQWVEHCKKKTEELEIEFVSNGLAPTPAAPGENIEAWARHARYQWLSSICCERDIILTAHHADDQAETFLMNLFQGKSIYQLAGIAEQRKIGFGSSAKVIRPLLGINQDQLRDYAKHHGLDWIEDPSNREVSLYRNFVRHEVLPILSDRNPKILDQLGSATENCRKFVTRETRHYSNLMESITDPPAKRIFCIADPLSLDSLLDFDVIEFSGIIRYWLHGAGCRSPRDAKLAELYQQLKKCQSNPTLGPALHGSNWVIRKYHGHIYLTKPLNTGQSVPQVWDLKELQFPDNNLRVIATLEQHSGLDVTLARKHCLVWRYRRGGERIVLANRSGSASLKKLWQLNRIPPWERDNLPVLVCNNEVVWAWGAGISGAFTAGRQSSGICPQFSLSID